MVPQQFELVENEQERVAVERRVEAVELTATARQADERARPRDACRGAGLGRDALLEPGFGATDGSSFRLRRGRARRHDRSHLGVVGARETDLGAERASEAVANDDAVWSRRGERPL